MAENQLLYDLVNELAVIAETTRVMGNIRTDGHIAIAGTIDGDIDAKGNVAVTGIVKGSVVCDNLSVDGGHILSAIEAKGAVSIGAGSVINESITCTNALICGDVRGPLIARERIAITSTAVINADIVAKEISVEAGAKIFGALRIG